MLTIELLYEKNVFIILIEVDLISGNIHKKIIIAVKPPSNNMPSNQKPFIFFQKIETRFLKIFSVAAVIF